TLEEQIAARRAEPIASNEYEAWPQGPVISAQGAVLMDADTGTVLYEKNMHEHLYPASTTKVLTCLIGAERCAMNETVVMSR
ncbi:D-alanyl-D-alanine carboxypeptidase, partial [Xanthomonas citri pv. citri]|nr:D-alanyl-D-alanine carboxypeptidase [Xanthomonas citri pv. citri]